MDLRRVAPAVLANRPRPGTTLQTWRTGGRVGAKHPAMGAAGIWRGDGRPGAGHRQPGLQGGRSGIRAQTIRRSGHFCGGQLPGQPDARHGGRRQAQLPGSARGHQLCRLGCLHRHRQQRPNAAARGEIRRPGDDPVHLGHHRLPQRRLPAPPGPGQQRRAHAGADGAGRRRRLPRRDAAVSHGGQRAGRVGQRGPSRHPCVAGGV